MCCVCLCPSCVHAKKSRHVPYTGMFKTSPNGNPGVRGFGNCFKTVSMMRKETGFGLFFSVARGTFDLSHSP